MTCHLRGALSGELGEDQGRQTPGSGGSKRWGRGGSLEGRRPKATPFGYVFPLGPLQLPAAPAKHSPTLPYPNPRPRPLLRPDCGHQSRWGRSATRKPSTGAPQPRRANAFRTGTNHSLAAEPRVLRRAQFPDSSVVLNKVHYVALPEPIGREQGGKGEGGGGKTREKTGWGGASNQLCNPALPRAIRRHA